MTISSEDFRDALRHFAAGVTLVTAGEGEKAHGLTVSAFTSISADPPLIAVVIDRRHGLHSLLGDDGAGFAVNILGAEQADLSDRFAYAREDRFGAGTWTVGTTGAPVLEESLVWLDCRVESRHSAGSHIVYIGRVEASRVNRADQSPLIYWNRAYRQLTELEGESS